MGGKGWVSSGVRQDITRLTEGYKISFSHFSIYNLHSTLMISQRKLCKVCWALKMRENPAAMRIRKVKMMTHSEEEEFLQFTGSRSSEKNKINVKIDYWTDKAKIGKYSVVKSTKQLFSVRDEAAGILNDCIERYLKFDTRMTWFHPEGK